MPTTEDYKVTKAISDVKAALDSLDKLTDRQRTCVIKTVFGEKALQHLFEVYNIYNSDKHNADKQ